MKKASWWQLEPDGQLVCRLCPRQCRIEEGKTGFCRVRERRDDTLWSLNYGEVSSIALDPVEKKPLQHFMPGKKILSVGSWGCNLACQFCQNYSIAQLRPTVNKITPKELTELAVKLVGENNIGVAYTYAEPLVWYEFVLETAQLIRQAGLKNVLVSNGYIEAEPLKELAPWLDAANIDLKGFDDSFYQTLCASGGAEPVKRTIAALHETCHVEVTTLIIPGSNDSEEHMERLAAWLAAVDRTIPLHISRYFPRYKMVVPATDPACVRQLAKIAARYLTFVHTGNL